MSGWSGLRLLSRLFFIASASCCCLCVDLARRQAVRSARESHPHIHSLPCAQLHLETCREYAKNPPGPEWKGVRVVTTK